MQYWVRRVYIDRSLFEGEREAAKAANSSELKVVMKDAGVIGVPTVWITRRT